MDLGMDDLISTEGTTEFSPDLSLLKELPVEVFSKIFHFLDFNNQNSMRLVCKEWYDMLNTKSLLEYQTCCIKNIFSQYLMDILQIFMDSRRKCFNFEFDDLDLDTCSLSFWETCGSRIYSLNLKDRSISSKTLSIIIKYCTNLQKLSLQIEFFSMYNNRITMENIDTFIHEGITNLAVQSLELNFCKELFKQNDPYWSQIFSKFHKLFPRILCFTFGCFTTIEDDQDFYYMEDEVEKIRFFHVIDKMLPCNREMKFRLQVCTSEAFEWNVSPSYPLSIKLKEIIIDVTQIQCMSSFIDFLDRQCNLEALHCTAETIYPEYTEHHVLLILKHCPNLRVFNLRVVRGVLWSEKWFEHLAASKITVLKIESPYITFPQDISYSYNETLKILSVYVNNYLESSLTPLIEAFSNLKTLKLNKVSHNILQTICSFQTNLEVLILSEFQGKNKRNFIPFSIKQLRRLRILSIPTEIAILEKDALYSFPHLKYLHIGYNNNSSKVQIVSSHYSLLQYETIASSLLETVIIDTDYIPFNFKQRLVDLIVEFITPLKKLRYLYFSKRLKFKFSKYERLLADEDISKIFDICPSLRFMAFEKVYSFNTIKRKIVTKSWDDNLWKDHVKYVHSHCGIYDMI